MKPPPPRVLSRRMDDAYRDLLKRADEHFRDAIEARPGDFSCRRGCTLCCHGLFEISAADVAMLVESFQALPDVVRKDVESRARRIFQETDHPDLRSVDPVEKERFFSRASELPCPALSDEGECRIYDDRPLVCRTFGLPLRDGKRFLGEECELNFTTASRPERERLAWDLQDEDVLGPDDQYTVPEAILLAVRLQASRR